MLFSPEDLFMIADINVKIKSYKEIHSVLTEIHWKNLIYQFASLQLLHHSATSNSTLPYLTFASSTTISDYHSYLHWKNLYPIDR